MRITYVFVAFCPCWNKNLDCRQINGEVRIRLHCVKLYNFLLNCIYCINVSVIELAHCFISAVSEKYCILHIAFISSIASSSKCSEFNFILLFNFPSKPSFLEYLVSPYYTGPTLTPAPLTPPLLALFFKCPWSNSYRQTYNAGPYNAISRKISPFGAGIIMAKKVCFSNKDLKTSHR